MELGGTFAKLFELDIELPLILTFFIATLDIIISIFEIEICTHTRDGGIAHLPKLFKPFIFQIINRFIFKRL
jgi:hypothetical protein